MDTLLTTQRLLIKEPTLNDFDNIYALQTNPEVMHFIGNGIRDKNEVQLGLEKSMNHHQKYQFSLGSVYEKESHAFVGRAGLIYFNYDENQLEIELAYALLPNFWGKGYATELTQSLIEFAFGDLKLQKIIAVVHPENNASQNVLIKCGMMRAGMIYYWGKEVMKFEKLNQS